MDIEQALFRLTTPINITGSSNLELVRMVTAKQAPAGSADPQPKIPTPAVGLESGSVKIRPIDALHRLVRATALTVEDDVYTLFKHWGWLRYLGAFDHGGSPPNLILNKSALRHVHANQRRVISEDLGIGFGILLAEEWCRAMGAKGTIRAIDVDKALRNDRGLFGLTRAPGTRRQPDYLLQYSSPGSPTSLESRLLETKGTVDSRNGVIQLAHAMSQLVSLVLDGGTPPGLAISTVSTTSGISYLAVDPEGESDSWVPEETIIQNAKTKPPSIRDRGETLYVNRDEFLASATVTANAALADFAGHDEVAAIWLPQDAVLQSRHRRRTVRQIDFDTGTYSGIEFSTSTPGSDARLTVFQGLERGVVEALRRGNDELVRDAQHQFTTSAGIESITANQHPSDHKAIAISGDGAILCVTLEDRDGAMN